MADIQELAETTLGKMERFSVKAELKRASEVIQAGETVQMLGVGNYKGAGNSLIIATDQRIIALNETGSFVSKKLQVHDIAYGRISHVGSETGRLGKLSMNASGGDIEIDKFLPGERAGEIASYIRDRMNSGSSVAPAAVSVADDLRKLADLRDAGIVTPEEFESKKAELLARM